MNDFLKNILEQFRNLIPNGFDINNKEFCNYDHDKRRVRNEDWQDIIKCNEYWNPNIHYEFMFNEKGTTYSINLHIEYLSKKYGNDKDIEELANILSKLESKIKKSDKFRNIPYNNIKVHLKERFNSNNSERANLEINLKGILNKASDIAELMKDFIELTNDDISSEYKKLGIKAPTSKKN